MAMMTTLPRSTTALANHGLIVVVFPSVVAARAVGRSIRAADAVGHSRSEEPAAVVDRRLQRLSPVGSDGLPALRSAVERDAHFAGHLCLPQHRMDQQAEGQRPESHGHERDLGLRTPHRARS